MRKMQNGVVIITGASSGIGRSVAELFLEAGATVYVTARRVERMEDLVERGATAIGMDVTDPSSIRSGVDRILKEAGGVDILVNNAGYGSYGAIEDVPLEEGKRQFDVNIFGLAEISRAVLPSMRSRGQGRIINIGSVGGRIYTSLGGWYHATKFALEGLTDVMRNECAPFGIDVVLIRPGTIKSEWDRIATESMMKYSGETAYAEQAARAAEGFSRLYGSPRASSLAVVARTIFKAAVARRPRTRYAVGYMAGPALFFRRICSDRLFDRLMRFM